MRRIALRSTKYPGLYALVDDEDYDLVDKYAWWPRLEQRTGNFYARGRLTPGDRAETLMHRFLTGVDGVDHRDGNGLNNQRGNLRLATRSQQCQNRAKASSLPYKGIKAPARRSSLWAAQIKIRGKNNYLGSFITMEEAARAYDKAAREAFGEYARVNFPEEYS